jgi:hypothetical protein
VCTCVHACVPCEWVSVHTCLEAATMKGRADELTCLCVPVCTYGSCQDVCVFVCVCVLVYTVYTV